MRKRIGVLLIVLMSAAFAGCTERHQGPAERAGERIDEVVDNAKEGKPLLHKKGPLEKAGEDIDDSLDSARRRD